VAVWFGADPGSAGMSYRARHRPTSSRAVSMITLNGGWPAKCGNIFKASRLAIQWCNATYSHSHWSWLPVQLSRNLKDTVVLHYYSALSSSETTELPTLSSLTEDNTTIYGKVLDNQHGTVFIQFFVFNW